MSISEPSNSSSKTRGAAAPHTRITCAYFLGSEEPSLKLSRLAKLQCTNSSPNSNCRRSKSAIFISRNINSNINSFHINSYIYIYISVELYIPEVEMKTIYTKKHYQEWDRCILPSTLHGLQHMLERSFLMEHSRMML